MYLRVQNEIANNKFAFIAPGKRQKGKLSSSRFDFLSFLSDGSVQCDHFRIKAERKEKGKEN